MTTFPTLVCDGMGSVFLLDSERTGVVIRAAFGTGWEEGKALTKREVESRVRRCRQLPIQLVRVSNDVPLRKLLADIVIDQSATIGQVKHVMYKHGEGALRPADIPIGCAEQVKLEADKLVEKNKRDKRTIENAIDQPVERLGQSVWWLNRRWDEMHNASQCIGANHKTRAIYLAKIRAKFEITHVEAVQLCSALAAVYTLTKGTT